MPVGYVDAVGAGEEGINWRPKLLPEPPEGKPATKSELVSEAASRSGLTRSDVDKAYNALVAVMLDHLASGGKLRVDKLGTFTVMVKPPVDRALQRQARFKQRRMAARKTGAVRFAPAAALRQAITEHDEA
ncbi:HU family DNA-binding protein [Brevundimonas sp.]|uniref:HU family DNA-binding protein n=1 Tax=Brevundimonas sp. TaxID=1871086 RepID=UPI002E0D3BD6|nr:HU family DNA-binding protein [Brevundimonas sp.]